MENIDISHEFEKAVMNYFIEHVVLSTDGTAFKSFVKTVRERRTQMTQLSVMK